MGLIERKRVRSAFHGQAERYDEKAVVQKRVVGRMVGKIREGWTGPVPRRVLDIGSGTGMLLREVRSLFPASFLAGLDLAPAMGRAAMRSLAGKGRGICVEGDAERLPFAEGTFDLVLSSSTFQWLNSLDTAFSEVRRVLAPGGTFLFALFGEGTLRELQECYRKALVQGRSDIVDRSHRFFSGRDVNNALERAGFFCCHTETVMEREFHADVPTLLRSLRGIGAGNASPPATRGLAGRKVMMHMFDAYEREYSEDGLIPATYVVVLGEGKKV
jgi:malonyl-CoA O-methyltransferase